MSDIGSAIQFVRRHGNNIELARLNVLLHEECSIREAVDELKALQRSDGGFAPFWAPGASSIDATCYRLAQCEQLGLTSEALNEAFSEVSNQASSEVSNQASSGISGAGSGEASGEASNDAPMEAPNQSFIDDALSFIINRQSEDGSFEESPELASVAPPWAMPGDTSASIYLTSNAGYWIRYYRKSDPTLGLIRDFLISMINDEGYLPSFHHANWLAAGLFHSMGEVAAADGILARLHSTLPKLDASNLAWLINALGVMGVPSGIPLLAEATDRLQGLQREDGRWPSEDGEWQDVHTTLESIRALQSFSVSS